MKNFLRVVRLTFRRRFTLALAIACSVGVAFLWGANLGLIKPTIEIVFHDQEPHDLVNRKVAEREQKAAATQRELEQITSRLAGSSGDERRDVESKIKRLRQRLALEQRAVWAAHLVQSLAHRCLPNSKFLATAMFIGILVVATLLKDVMLVCNLVLVEQLTQLSTLELRNQLFRRTLSMDMAHFGEGHSSHIMQRIKGDLDSVYYGVSALCGRLILEPLKLLACLVGAAFICWKLLVISLLIAPLAAWVVARLMRSIRKANKRALEEMGHLYTLLGETLTNMQTVKAFGMERFERRRYHQGGKNYFHRAMRISLYSGLARAASEVMGMTIICLAIVVGAYLVIHQQTTLLGISIMDEPLSLGSLMAFYAFLVGVTDPARKISEVVGVVQRGIVAADRVYEILDYRPAIIEPTEPKAVRSLQPELVFDRVSFQYAPEHRVLNEVELRIPFGETVAIVGPNGCGKTTLVNLLPRFCDPTAGAVRLDGIDLRDLRLKELRRMIGLVAQQAMLFDDTILNNIRYGSPHASDDEVIAAAEQAFAHRFILEKLTEGYATTVGERGCRLSGGQRQRILLARAILRNPKFLILDEATSQVDLESEQLIHRVLEQFVRGRTTLLITHRMSSIALADRIVVMDNGRIIDAGKHHELLGRCELYMRLQQLGFQRAA
jgi:ATP-binding cassette subfamily B protein/subfamily B ATP-binding cassette protein MsbA